MTTSSHEKMFTQLKNKPIKLVKYVKHNTPKKRTCGKSLRRCKICGNLSGHVGRYGIHLCRKCFRDMAKTLGFKKYR